MAFSGVIAMHSTDRRKIYNVATKPLSSSNSFYDDAYSLYVFLR